MLNLRYFAWLVRVFIEKRIIQYRIRPFYNPRVRSTNKNVAPLAHDQTIITFFLGYRQDSTPEEVQRTLKSILGQSVPGWQCRIAHPWSDGYSDPRIIPQPLGGSAVFTLAGLSNVSSKYLVVLEPGDEIVPDFVQRIGSADGDILYFDQAIRREKTEQVFLKPQWSPELWLNVDVLYSAAFRLEHLRKVVQSNPVDGLGEAVRSAQSITHLPVVLIRSPWFPWENAALRNQHKQVVSAYLQDLCGLDCWIAERPNGSLSIHWKPGSRKVSIIIPNRDHYEDLHTCLESLYSITDYPAYEVIIIDDSSQDAQVQELYTAYCARYDNFSVLPGIRPFNFSRACNRGAEFAKGDYLLFLNNDVEIVERHWLTNLTGVLQIPGVGAVGAKLLYPDGSVQHAGIVIGLEGHASHVFMGQKEDRFTPHGFLDWQRNVSAVTGACMMVRRDVYALVNGFDEALTLVFNDVDLCLRIIDAGYRVVFNPDVSLIHYEGRSRGKYIPKEDFLARQAYFLGRIKKGDPYYHPDLSRAWRIPAIRQRWEMDPADRYQQIIQYKFRS